MEIVGLKHTNKKIILGIDGGGTKTSAILLDSIGNTIDSMDCLGSNLYVYGEEGIKRIIVISIV